MSRSPKSVRPEIIFDGVKTFEKLKKTELEIVLVNHTELTCLEVIAKIKDHIVRMYLDMKMLIKMIDLVTINAKYQIKRKSAEEKKIPFDCGQMMRNLATKMVVKMITDRLEITRVEDAVTSGIEFDIFLKPTNTDRVSDYLDHESGEYFTKFDFELGEKPAKLRPYNILHHGIRKIKFDDIDKVEILRTNSSSPRSASKSVRFAFPLDDRHSPVPSDITDTTSSEEGSVDNNNNNDNEEDCSKNLSMMLPSSCDEEESESEGEDDDEESFEIDHHEECGQQPQEEAIAVMVEQPVQSQSHSSGHKRGIESPSAVSWTRRFLNLLPCSPPRQSLKSEV